MLGPKGVQMRTSNDWWLVLKFCINFTVACWRTRWSRPTTLACLCGAAAGAMTTTTMCTQASLTARCGCTTCGTPAHTCMSCSHLVPGQGHSIFKPPHVHWSNVTQLQMKLWFVNKTFEVKSIISEINSQYITSSKISLMVLFQILLNNFL